MLQTKKKSNKPNQPGHVVKLPPNLFLGGDKRMKKVVLCTHEEYLRLMMFLKLSARQEGTRQEGQHKEKDILAAFERGKKEAMKK